jgi:hypothetical protein
VRGAILEFGQRIDDRRGACAIFRIFLFLWLYYTAQIFLFGAEFTACLGGLRDKDPNTLGEPKSQNAFGAAGC